MPLIARDIIFVSLFFAAQPLFGQSIPRFEDEESAVIDLPKDQKIRFGYLVVFEDRSKKGGKTLRLPVFILKSRSRHPKQDPVLYTAGGPGSSSVNAAKYGEYYSYLNERDFIVFEQRGTRYAKPNLGCFELDSIKKSNSWVQLNDKQKEALQVQAAKRCQTRLIAEGINLSMYNTKASADDIEDLRKVLRVKQFNLYTVSYSTKIAQVLLRDYPTSIRSAVMDSPLPLWVNYDESSLHYFSKKLYLLFSACATDSACSLAYPNLKTRFLHFLQQANKVPIMVDTKSPFDSSNIKVALKGSQIASFLNLGETYNLKGLPKLMSELCDGNYVALQPFINRLFSDDNHSMGMRLSVWCAEEYPFEKLSSTGREAGIPSAYQQMKSEAVPLAICKIWKVVPVNAQENKTFTTNVPVLLVNGEFDPDTPSAWGAAMAKQFTRSYHFMFKGMSHTPTQYWDNGCGMQLAQTFFDNPLQRPKLKCFTDLTPLAFETEKR